MRISPWVTAPTAPGSNRGTHSPATAAAGRSASSRSKSACHPPSRSSRPSAPGHSSSVNGRSFGTGASSSRGRYWATHAAMASERPRCASASAAIGPWLARRQGPYRGAVAANAVRAPSSASVSMGQVCRCRPPRAVPLYGVGRHGENRVPVGGLQRAEPGRRVEGVMGRVRLGVLGAGNIAALSVRGYLEDPRCDLVAVCDTDEDAGRRAAGTGAPEPSTTTSTPCWPTTPSTRSKC